MLVFLILNIVFVTLGFYWYNRRKFKMSLLERSNIPGPKPHWFYGNIREYNGMENVLWDTHMTNRFGSISGYYLGRKPVILVSDPDLLHIIQKTENNKFLERPRKVPGGINPDPHRALMLGNLNVTEWTRMRHILSPSFTPNRLKQMCPTIISIVDKMISSVTPGTEQNFYEMFKTLTLDIIGNTAFGIASNIQENPDDPLMDAVAAEFSKSTNSLLITLFLCLPEISPLLSRARLWHAKWSKTLADSSPLWNLGRRALRLRREEGQDNQIVDLLERLVGPKANLSSDQIVANSVLFFEAAYETLSSSLGFIVHLLVNHQVVQDKIRVELVEFLERHDLLKLEYSALDSELKYMESAIHEALRLFPPQTTFIGRAACQDYKFEKTMEDGRKEAFVIPKGVHIQVGLYQLHHSDFWTDAETFDPTRFSADKPKSETTGNIHYESFGAGRRECIGKRFAMLVLKLTLAKLLSQYKLVPSPRSEEQISIQYKVATMTPRYGSWAIAIPVKKE